MFLVGVLYQSLTSNPAIEQVQLNITARALIYNTSEARDMCMVAQGRCSLPVLFAAANYAVLTTHLKQASASWAI